MVRTSSIACSKMYECLVSNVACWKMFWRMSVFWSESNVRIYEECWSFRLFTFRQTQTKLPNPFSYLNQLLSSPNSFIKFFSNILFGLEIISYPCSCLQVDTVEWAGSSCWRCIQISVFQFLQISRLKTQNYGIELSPELGVQWLHWNWSLKRTLSYTIEANHCSLDGWPSHYF